jgi:hypothetical protein
VTDGKGLVPIGDAFGNSGNGPVPFEGRMWDASSSRVAGLFLGSRKICKSSVVWHFQKVRSTITNIIQSGVEGLGDSVGAYQRNKIWVTKAPTQKFWFTRFMEGLHKRVGEIRMPDKILTIEEVHTIDRMMEREWKYTKTKTEQKRISEMATWMSGGVCTGLRGEEMLLIYLFGTAKSVAQFMRKDSVNPHFKFVIIRRTKGVQEDGHKFAIPCIKEMMGTHLRPRVWFEWLINVKRELGQTHGKVFARNLQKAKL